MQADLPVPSFGLLLCPGAKGEWSYGEVTLAPEDK